MKILMKNNNKFLEKIIGIYDLGKIKSINYIDFTVDNKNYVVETSKGEFVVKIFATDDFDFICFQNDLQLYLFRNNFKVPAIILYDDNSSSVKIDGKYVSVYEFVEGSHPKRLSTELVRNLGKTVGQMHKLLLEWDFDIKKYSLCYSQETLSKLDVKKLRKSFIHSDLGRLNFLVKDKNINAVIDFEDAHYDYLVNDLGTMFAELFISKGYFKYINVFMKEYLQYIDLNNEEKKAIYYLVEQRLKGVLHRINEKITNNDYNEGSLPHLKKGISKVKKKLSILHSLGGKEFIKLLKI